MREESSLLADVVKGAVAGAVATWVMGRVTSFMYEHEAEDARDAEEAARGGKTAFESAAEKAPAVGTEASSDQLERAGSAIHWGLGVGAGAVYGAIRGRVLHPGWRAGMEFGGGFFVLVDELANPVLGLTPGPRAFPWQAHARGLAGHTVFGVTAEAVMRLLDRIR